MPIALAQTATNEIQQLPKVLVTAESEASEAIQAPFLPPVQGTQIYAGKKSSVLDLDELPRISNNNYRQALTKTPGLLLSEETTPLVSIGYRGLNPHRAQFTQVLKDGIPIHADPFGYPEAYYTPSLDTVDRIEFLRGGASLMYGPQPGGALNYVTHRPRTDREFSARSQHILGSDSLYNTFNSVDGTIDRVGYYASFNRRQGQGFRETNSDFELNTGNARLVLDADKDSRWVFSFDGYAENHGEPGGLTLASGPNSVNYEVQRNSSSRPFDRFELDRYFASLAYERDFSEDTALTVTGWGGYYSRYSSRQRGGGFGTLPSGASATSNTIEHQEFYTQGLEARLRHDWTAGGNTHTVAAGVQLFHNDSPRMDQRGTTPDATTGLVRHQSQRELFYAPVFLENRFVLSKLSITPGVRLENIHQSVEEELNLDKTAVGTALGDQSSYEFVPLPGLGLEYAVTPEITGYGNLSRSYRPKVFTEAVPTGANNFVNADLNAGSSWQYEVGIRGQPRPWLNWDTSLFWIDFDDQIGSVAVPNGVSIENVGRARHLGWEASGEVELFGLAQTLRGESDIASDHQVSLYGNLMWLDAEFISGPRDGNTPQYAPEHLIRTGVIYRWQDRVKLAFLGTFTDKHFADDGNTVSFAIPSYAVWDLTLEWKVYRSNVSVLAGVNNLFDEDYYARIRADGIDPAYGRNYYMGLALAF